jgi:hypothetical protein
MASRREEKEQRRQERLARERAQLADTRKRRMYSIVAGSVLALGAIVAIVVVVAAGGGGGANDSALGFSKKAETSATPPPEKIADLPAAAKAAGCRLANPPIEGRTHVTGKVKYKTNPPTSGNHYPIPQDDGVYTKTPPFTHLVHTLEHGRIEFQYKPGASAADVAKLRRLASEPLEGTAGYHVVLFENNTDMPAAFAATAWTHSITCSALTPQALDAMREFRKGYTDKAPEFIP